MSENNIIAFADFLKVDIRSGTVIKAEAYPEARKPAIKLWIDFGPDIGIKKTSAQLTGHYTPESLLNSQISAVVNFPAKQIGKFRSECLVLGYADEQGEIILTRPEKTVPNGAKLH